MSPRLSNTSARSCAADTLLTPSACDIHGDGPSHLRHWLRRPPLSLISLDRSLPVIYLFEELAFGFIDFPLLFFFSILPVSTLIFNFLVLLTLSPICSSFCFLKAVAEVGGQESPSFLIQVPTGAAPSPVLHQNLFFSFSSKILSLLISFLDQLF